jgi:hypothetical protein
MCARCVLGRKRTASQVGHRECEGREATEEGVIDAVEVVWMHAAGEGLCAVVEEYAVPEAKIRASLVAVGASLRGVLQQYNPEK